MKTTIKSLLAHLSKRSHPAPRKTNRLEQPTANRERPTAKCKQPTANPPTAHSQKPTTNRERPIAKGQQPTADSTVFVNLFLTLTSD